MDHDMATFRLRSITGHLEKSTRDSYKSGVRDFKKFSLKYDLDDSLWSAPQDVIFLTIEHFACFMRLFLDLSSSAIGKYITHVTTFMRERGLPANILLRSVILGMLLRSWKKIDHVLPKALRNVIPCPASVFILLVQYIKERFPRDAKLASLYSSTVALAFAFGLRPGHYTSDGTHIILGDSVEALFNVDDNASYPVTVANNYPPSAEPIALLVFQKDSKNEKEGYGAPFIIHRSPPFSPFCLVSLIFSHLRRYPPSPDAPLLSGGGKALSQDQLNNSLKEFATHIGLDPKRFSASSFRVGHTIQTDTLSDFEQMRTTGHYSKHGKIKYLRASIPLAERTASLLCDTKYHTLHMVKLQSGCH